ncbi:hypothetical protein N7476_009875 [Penicillium atrosanguineum]|uniref:Zn(2)-C6 fungal-type domain-containing protein n=1 Tax=Penicillium atrosanguineum TaxID=1132637 RepID=A0A9W9U0B3_9EURO|nr:hypothetical protein N7476_009875 [Penicillium atrosanguineum]
MESSDAREISIQQGTETETPACQSCRSRKLRCSREVPACSRCSRLGRSSLTRVECHYDYTRNKPGVKVGIIQTLTQRVELLEAELEAVRVHQQPHAIDSCPVNAGHDAGAIRGLVSSLMEEWVQNRPYLNQSQQPGTTSLLEVHDDLPQRDTVLTELTNRQSNKRRHTDQGIPERCHSSAQIPPDNLVNAILDAYFSIVHPFIPIIHEMLFRSRLRDPNERPKLVVVLHAMMVCALRYVANERLATDWLETYPDASQRSRELVILSGMDGLSVENLQALVIVTFVHIGDGEANKAWPLIGTLARGVVYLGLHTEPEETQRGEVSLKPLSSLSPARVWTEAEERRRVFWNVFLLDRFCSTATGEDVQVRLPSDGLYWVKEEPVTTPFFNVWDSSLGRMGKSVSFLPSHFTSLADQDKQSTATAPTSERVTPDGRVPENRSVDVSTIGSFAYCVEATESLNRVVKFFLQRPVDFQSKQEFRAWLTRFKELDLQLIHWKMFLPRRWKDSNISKEPAFVHMDPNLTLAHITHNTSMILLHQSIAYPRASILEKVRLASTASAETCQLAASETANIVQKYLQYTPFVGLVNHQFSLCTYLSARLDIPDAYHILLSSLQQMSSRWVSMNPSLKLTSNATDFSQGLSSQLHTLQRMIGSPSFNVTASDYVAEVNHALGVKLPAVSPGESQWLAERRTQQRHSIIPVGARHSHYLDTNGLRTGSDHQSPFSHTYVFHRVSLPITKP